MQNTKTHKNILQLPAVLENGLTTAVNRLVILEKENAKLRERIKGFTGFDSLLVQQWFHQTSLLVELVELTQQTLDDQEFRARVHVLLRNYEATIQNDKLEKNIQISTEE